MSCKRGFCMLWACRVVVFGVVVCCLEACVSKREGVESAYRRAVRDAAVALESELAHDLIAVDPQNADLIWNQDKSRLLVVSWKSRESYEKYMKNQTHTSSSPDYVIWVTTAPQVQSFCRQYLKADPKMDKAGLDLRLKQYLGLSYAWQYDVFVEMWVKPTELFRPCVDPQIDDSRCNLHFGDSTPEVQGIADYPAFYHKLYYSDFRFTPGVPWTGLGYTYDWGNASNHRGASEFILTPGAAYRIERVVDTMSYCR